jgi:serine/threonine-protein kinase RsbT
MEPSGKPPGPEKAPHSSPISSQRSAAPTPAASRRTGGADAPGLIGLDGFALQVLRELSRHISEPNARALLLAAASASGVAVSRLGPSQMPALITQITKTFEVFGLAPDAKKQCLANLQALSPSGLESEVVIPIVKEDDIVASREAGKQMCQRIGFTDVACVKVATVISELARNIWKYAGEGSITARVFPGPRRGIEIVASDHGPGIPDIEAVLSPRYRSRSGMGMGLRGTRRVMDHLEIKSNPGRGTTVITRKFQD